MSKMYASTAEMFWNKVEKTSGCWVWKAGRNRQGYGLFNTKKLAKPRFLAHRYSYEFILGKPLLPGQSVLHLCDNPPCVRPSHLSVGTIAENNRQAKERGRTCAGIKNAKFKFANADIRSVLAESGKDTAQCVATKFNMSEATVRRIWRGERKEFEGAEVGR